MSSNPRIAELRRFLQFLDEARGHLQANRISERHADVQQIRGAVEEYYRDERGKPAMYQKFESAFYEDAPALVALWDYFGSLETEDLRRFHKLTGLELGGLTGDRHPAAILGRSVFGTAAVLMGAVTVWWGLIKMVSGDNLGKLFSDLFLGLLPAGITNRLAGVIWLVGMFVVVWYVLRMARNRKQVAFLSTLSRALDLYLAKKDSKTRAE